MTHRHVYIDCLFILLSHSLFNNSRQKFNKKMYIIGGVVVVIIIAVVVFLFIGGSSKKTEPKSTRPLRPSGHVGACAIVKMNDTDGVLMMQHNVSIIESELKKPNIEGLVYEVRFLLLSSLSLLEALSGYLINYVGRTGLVQEDN